MCVDKNCEKFFFSVLKMFKKVNKKHTTYNKAYLGRFIDSKRLKNASLDIYVNNLSNKKCKECKKRLDCSKKKAY